MRVSAVSPPPTAGRGNASPSCTLRGRRSSLRRVARRWPSSPGTRPRRCAGASRGPASGRSSSGATCRATPQVRALAAEGGRSPSTCPPRSSQWYAAIDPGRASSLASFVPGYAARSRARRVARRRSPRDDRRRRHAQAADRAPARARHRRDRRPELRTRTTAPRGRAPSSTRFAAKSRPRCPRAATASRRPRASNGASTPRSSTSRPGRIAAGRARAAPRRPDAGRARLRSARARAPELRLARRTRRPRAVAGRRRHRLRGADRAQHRRRLLVGDRDARPRLRVSVGHRRRGHHLQQGLRPLRRVPVPADAPVPPFKHTNMAAIFRAVRSGRQGPLLPAQPPAPAEGHRLLRQHRLRSERAAVAPPQSHRFRRDRSL